MTYQGIMVDVSYCTGCEACVLACQQEHGYTEREFGVRVTQLGPLAIDAAAKHYEYDFIPQFTEWCDLCAERTAKGKLPACVHSCYTGCMKFGTVEELSAELERKSRQVLFVPLQED